jgi:hypothetical protein
VKRIDGESGYVGQIGDVFEGVRPLSDSSRRAHL